MDTKQKQAIYPSYFKDFQCIGGNCEDTCCAGWYLPVDEATYKKYKKVKQPEMKRRLDKELVVKKGVTDPSCMAKIKLKNGRCAFLSKQGWCEIYTELGAQYLSESCTFYPRTASDVNGKVEYSLTLSCPEAARKVLLNQEGIRFNQENKDKTNLTISASIKTDGQKPKKWQDYLESYRKTFIEILQDRKEPLAKRIEVVATIGVELENTVTRYDLKKIPNILTHKYKSTQGIVGFSEKNFNVIMDYLKVLADGKKLHSISYQEFIKTIVDIDYGVYQKALETYHNLFAVQLDYILENYLVNYIYERCVPIDAQTPYESIKRVIFYYQFIHLHLMGMIVNQGVLKEEEIVALLQGFTKVYDHGEDYMNKLLKMTEDDICK